MIHTINIIAEVGRLAQVGMQFLVAGKQISGWKKISGWETSNTTFVVLSCSSFSLDNFRFCCVSRVSSTAELNFELLHTNNALADARLHHTS